MEFSKYFYVRVAFLTILLHLASGDCRDLDLGLENGKILDNNITSSTNTEFAKSGRLRGKASWCASPSDVNPYLQINLQRLHIICAVSTQGNSQADEWVKSFTIQASTNGRNWTDYKESGQVKIFLGNEDRNTEQKNAIYEGILAKSLRIVGKTSHNKFCLRAELYGVMMTPENLARGKPTEQSSDYKEDPGGQSSKAVDGNADTDYGHGHCSRTLQDNPSWWLVDMGSDYVPVSEVQIVNRFGIHSRRNEGYKITLGNKRTVASNPECVGLYSFTDFIATAVCYINPLATGRYLGIVTTKKESLQLCEVEVYSRENLAFRKTTKQGQGGTGDKAVDGNINTGYIFESCTHPQDHEEANSWWRVDLGQAEPVNEVYIVNRGDELSAFQIRVGRDSGNGGVTNPKCGYGEYSVPQGQGASFFCRPSLHGRYVTILRTKSRCTTLTLSEVEVYSARRACPIQSLGLASSYTFPDSSFSASSSRAGKEAPHGRLNGNGAWSPSTDRNAVDYLQINLQYEFYICAVATQGSSIFDHWTTKYKLFVSLNGLDWVTYQENNIDKIFNGNDGRNDIVKHYLVGIIRARYIRFRPTDYSTHKALRVEVYGVLKPSDTPVVQQLPNSIILRVGEMVKLSCRINGHPRPNVTWTKDGETNISRAQVTNNGQTLAIQSVLPTDGGVYKCIASNQFGESSTSTTLTVAVPPSIVKEMSPPSVLCEKQTKCLLFCHATSNFPLKYSWTKDGQTLAGRSNIKVINNTIIIRPRKESDYGVYVCRASNTYGTTAYNITLTLPDTVRISGYYGISDLALFGWTCSVFLFLLLIAVCVTYVVAKRKRSKKNKPIVKDTDRHYPSRGIRDSYLELFEPPSQEPDTTLGFPDDENELVELSGLKE